MNLYDSIKPSEAKKIVNNCKWYHKKDYKELGMDGEGEMLMNIYSGKQSFGYTDYKNHQNDTVEQIKELVMDSLINGLHQAIHYYDNETKKPYTKIECYGYLGGITAYFKK